MSAGRVGRAHGLDGSFYVTGARPRLLAPGTVLGVGGIERAILRRAGTEHRPIVRLEGIEDRTAAESLRGQTLTVDREHAPSLEQGEWWAGELAGCEVLDGERLVGVVRALIELPSCEALEVDRVASGACAEQKPGDGDRERQGPLLVPMVRDAIRSIDVSAKRIDVDMSFLEGER
jgi:16S rRNA processing protein RimM